MAGVSIRAARARASRHSRSRFPIWVSLKRIVAQDKRTALGGALRKGARGSFRQARDGAAECFGGVSLSSSAATLARQGLRRTAFTRILQNAFSMLFTPFLAEIADALRRDDKAAEGLSIIDEAPRATRVQRGALVRRQVSAHQR